MRPTSAETRRHRCGPLGVTALAIAVLVAGGLVACATAQSPPAGSQTQTPRAPDVPYVPTNEKVLDAMLAMARVTKQDVLYDLGSGDGRIPITAARRFGTRGVGIEIDPQRVREANENARAARVAHLVRFVEGDIFEADLREATVVTLYLLPEVNLKLRPKLLSELRPGTRIVSHNYDMGDWKPLRQQTIRVDNTDHVVYGWVVPPRAADR
jgi:predicted O-methyltransferase YrrM